MKLARLILLTALFIAPASLQVASATEAPAAAPATGETAPAPAGTVQAEPGNLFDDAPAKNPITDTEPVPPPSLGERPAAEKTELIQDYVSITYDNLARTLWAMNVHALDDDLMVDNFLRITECNLYNKFFMNEFEWEKIRDATRKYLMKYKEDFPRRYEYIQPLYLDRYDFALKGFELMKDSAFIQSTRLEMAANVYYKSKCGGEAIRHVQGYPDSVVLTTRRPFKLSFIRVNEALAKEYLAFVKGRYNDPKRGRPAFMRIRVRLDQHLPDLQISQGTYSNYGGVIETIEVFADRDLMFKLYEQAVY